jgi:hypothetical protein
MNKKIGCLDFLLVITTTSILSTTIYCRYFNVNFIDVWYRWDFILWLSILNSYPLKFIINDYKLNL